MAKRSANRSPIPLGLFELLDEYLDELSEGLADPEIDDSSPGLEFCENFFLHFMEAEADASIASIDARAKRIAVRARHALKKKRAPVETIRLITWFEKLTEIYNDILSIGYGDTTAANFFNFHERYVVVLLRRIMQWGNVKGYRSLEKAAKGSLKRLLGALETIPQS